MNWLTLVTMNLSRKTTRTTLTLISLTVAFLLYMLLRAVTAALSGGVTSAGVQRLIVDAKYSMTDNLPIADIQAIRDLPGVAEITQMVWFGGYYQDPKTTFTILPVDHTRYLQVFPEVEVDPAVYKRFSESRRAVIVHDSLATTYGWSVGDVIPVVGDIWPKSDGSWNWEFILAGTYSTPEGSRIPKALLLRHDYFNDSVADWVKDQVGWAVVRINGEADAKGVIDAIDGLFENSSDPTKSMTEDAYGQELANEIGDIGLIASMILAAVFFTIILLTANVVALGFRERIPELATMKSLGFTNNVIFALILGEAITLCLCGAGGGILLGLLFEPLLKPVLEPVLGFFAMSWRDITQALCIALLLGIGVGLPPALRARRLSIAQALRRLD